jgi:nucleotide-binding universal stress UspA family protein
LTHLIGFGFGDRLIFFLTCFNLGHHPTGGFPGGHVMLPLKRILCPTDFSSDARSALRVANEMALYFDAHLTLVHVVQPVMNSVYPVDGYLVNPVDKEPIPSDIIHQAQKSLSEEANDHISRDVTLSLEVLQGEPADTILKLAERLGIEMIVMAPHGHSRLHTALMGSTAEKIVRLSPCPVITLHAGQESAREPVELKAEKAES